VAAPEEPTIPERELPKCFGPYLRYAIATDFHNFEPFDEHSFKLFFLVEFEGEGSARAFEREITDPKNDRKFDIEFGPGDEHSRYATLRSRKAAVTDSSTFPIWDKFVARLELSLPIMASAGHVEARKTLRHRWEEGKDPPGSLLIGMLDDGCPFAAAQFLKSATSTRVRGIWDQNRRSLIKVKDGGGNTRDLGEVPTDFNYGLDFRRDFSPLMLPSPQMGLDEWIGLHSRAGVIDEDGCYAEAGFRSLARRQSHGALVMDVLAGRVPTSSRVGPWGPGKDRRDPPSWKSDTDLASSADVVFVQFSDACIRDATGVWLKAYVFDGIWYILSFADPVRTKNVVINISYGPTTGPHDGTAELEAALAAFVATFNGTPGRPRLEIVLPAGNAYLSEGHIAYKRRPRHPNHVEWTWRLPPDNTVLCFAEIWTDNAQASGITVTLTSPGGTVYTSPAGPISPPPNQPLPPYTGVYAPVVLGSHPMWLLSVQPTRDDDNPDLTAEHGDWTVKVTGIRARAEVHAYVARSDPNMGARTGAKRSYFVDHKWELTRSAEASCSYAGGEFDRSGSLLRRYGTLNGIATRQDSRVHVAAGYMLANGRHSPYSSAGPARKGPLTLRAGPDFALPCDESDALEGIRAGANRSGGVFRLIGTSIAAPQLARHVANGATPPADNIPTQSDEIAKRGGGNLPSP
jgi:hypothetical protein